MWVCKLTQRWLSWRVFVYMSNQVVPPVSDRDAEIEAIEG